MTSIYRPLPGTGAEIAEYSLRQSLKSWLWRYFSGKLVVIQLVGGCGAFIFRSLAAYFTIDHSTWSIVLASTLASYSGYIATYVFGYIVAFRKDYLRSGRSRRSIAFDIFRLQLVEQTPNVITFLVSILSQGALIEAGVSPVVSVNLASWFGPQKIVNVAAALISNTMKKSWVDRTWNPLAGMRRISMFLYRRKTNPQHRESANDA